MAKRQEFNIVLGGSEMIDVVVGAPGPFDTILGWETLLQDIQQACAEQAVSRFLACSVFPDNVHVCTVLKPRAGMRVQDDAPDDDVYVLVLTEVPGSFVIRGYMYAKDAKAHPEWKDPDAPVFVVPFTKLCDISEFEGGYANDEDRTD